MDPFADVIGVNRALLAFHDLSLAQLKAARATAAGANNIAFLLAPDGRLREMLGRGWRPIALANVQQWRAMTLRYRHTARFRQLFSALSAYPDFYGLWADSHEDGYDDYSRLRSYSYLHGAHGPVAYTIFTNTSLSAPLGSCISPRLCPRTASRPLFSRSWRVRSGQALSLAPWPNPSLG